MRRVDVPTLLARLEELRASGDGGAVAFDGDGTLWSGDVGDDWLDAFIAEGAFEAEAVLAMRHEAEAHGLDSSGSGADLARRLHHEHTTGRYPEDRLFELVAWCAAGMTRENVECRAREVMERNRLQARLHAEAVEVARWAHRVGVARFVVSASPLEVVAAAVAVVGIPFDGILASEGAYEHGKMVARAHRPIPYAAGKVTHLEAALGGRALYAAFGDNAFDVPMLAASRCPVAIRPKERLRARAAEVPGLLELEPTSGPPNPR